MSVRRLQHRRGTAAAWAAKGTVLAAGEPAFESDTGRQKVGDGMTAWADLPYVADPAIVGSSVDAHIGQALGDDALGVLTNTPTARGWVDLGVVPNVAAQTSSLGRRISDVVVFDGRVFAGYGDYNADTGPIHVMAYDLASSAWVDEATLAAEQVWYRAVGSRLFAVFMDPRGNPGTPSIAYRDAGGATWTTVFVDGQTNRPLAHSFDLIQSGGALYLCGQRDTGVNNPQDGFPFGDRFLPCVWRSLDNGATWTQWHLEPLTPGGKAQGGRFWMIGDYQAKLWVQSVESYDPAPWAPTPRARTWDGTSWADAPSLLPGRLSDGQAQSTGWRARPFTGARGAVGTSLPPGSPTNVLVYQGAPLTPSPLYTFDGRDRRTIHPAVRSTCVNADWIWTLDFFGRILTTNNAEQWNARMSRGPRNGVSLYADGAPPTAASASGTAQRIVVGTADSRVWMLTGPETGGVVF